MLGSVDSKIQAIGRARAILDEYHFVRRAGLNARRREEIGGTSFLVRNARDERQTAFGRCGDRIGQGINAGTRSAGTRAHPPRQGLMGNQRRLASANRQRRASV